MEENVHAEENNVNFKQILGLGIQKANSYLYKISNLMDNKRMKLSFHPINKQQIFRQMWSSQYQ